MAERKKRILFHSNYCGAPTGNGDNVKNIMTYLYKTKKYEIANYANQIVEGNPDFNKWPWKVFGSLPANQNQLNEINNNPGLQHKCGYGFYNLDKVITEFKPDIYISLEDFWQNTLCENINKKWWNKTNCLISWTADSKPLLKDSLELAPKIKNHYVWSKFAEKEFKREAGRLKKKLLEAKTDEEKKNLQEKITAYEQVKTIRGMMNTERFYPLELHQKIELRKKYNIDQDTFVIGSGSRNQLRKKFDTVIEGFSIFKKENPKVKTKLLFYTDLREGWDISRLADQYGINSEDILFVYKCRLTNTYVILPNKGQDIDNPINGAQKSLVTVGINDHLPVECINEFLNLLDCFTLPITSGGQEYWTYQAKLCEVPTLLNSYSCFEDLFDEETGSLEIDQAFTREIGTEFIKAAPYASSLAKQLKKAYEMGYLKRKELGKTARQWVLNNASIEVIGKQWEKIIEDFPIIEWDFNLVEKAEKKDPTAYVPPILDNEQWVRSLYKNILGYPNPDTNGLNNWLERLKNEPRDKIEQIFRQIAQQDNAKEGTNQNISLESLVDKKPALLLILKESIGDLVNLTALLPSIKKAYPDHYIYLATDPVHFEIFKYSKFIYRTIPYTPILDSEIAMTGQGENRGIFDIFMHAGVTTQKFLNYLTNNNIDLLK